MSSVGFRINERPAARISAEALAQFATVGSAQISDCMGRLYGVVGLAPRHAASALRMVGLAVTVKARPGDNLMIHKAIAMAQPGDVIVVDGAGETTNALVGELMAMDAEGRGVAGFVIDGAIRDADVFAQGAFPCFARAISHRGPYKDGPGEINVPIALDGMVIEPGDLVIGDDDGLLCVPFGQAEALLEAAHAKQVVEAKMVADIAAGTYSAPWIDETLKRLGCPAQG